MKNLKTVIFMLVVVVVIVVMINIKQESQKDIKSSKVLISLSTFSLYDIARHVAGDSVELVMILPFGVDPHSFEPTPKLMAKILKSDLVVYSGAGLEPWTEGFDFQGRVIDMSNYVKLREAGKHHNYSEHYHTTHFDPHYWLDINNMILATNIIADELMKVSPKNKDLYIKNKDKYILELKQLNDEYIKKLSICKGDTIIVNHNAFSYMANNYGFHIKSLSGLSPEAQPSAKKMVELIKEINKDKIPVVFFESFANAKAIKSVANEANIIVDVLHPLANITADEAKENLTYKEIMEQNLIAISKALRCQ